MASGLSYQKFYPGSSLGELFNAPFPEKPDVAIAILNQPAYGLPDHEAERPLLNVLE